MMAAKPPTDLSADGTCNCGHPRENHYKENKFYHAGEHHELVGNTARYYACLSPRCTCENYIRCLNPERMGRK